MVLFLLPDDREHAPATLEAARLDNVSEPLQSDVVERIPANGNVGIEMSEFPTKQMLSCRKNRLAVLFHSPLYYRPCTPLENIPLMTKRKSEPLHLVYICCICSCEDCTTYQETGCGQFQNKGAEWLHPKWSEQKLRKKYCHCVNKGGMKNSAVVFTQGRCFSVSLLNSSFTFL